jgi:D-methionine transport system permease protein
MPESVLLENLWRATVETFYMVGISAVLAMAVGLPLGLLLVITNTGGVLENSSLNQALGSIVNVGRSLPFIILLVAIIPLTRLIVGTTIGSTAALVPRFLFLHEWQKRRYWRSIED